MACKRLQANCEFYRFQKSSQHRLFQRKRELLPFVGIQAQPKKGGENQQISIGQNYDPSTPVEFELVDQQEGFFQKPQTTRISKNFNDDITNDNNNNNIINNNSNNNNDNNSEYK
eukprot:TRINITY_DN139759_c0_g1_i1.p1 TRINITY_DN139759_c0_g1~~TRINITY_DN139759_c0_g1_i1.p1  ORF type:complete len:123 (+),score=4.38 TRINITY_DN139759_c0_g1_i1:27-371(+)